MMKPLMWTGVVLIMIGAGVFALFVLPHVWSASVNPALAADATRSAISLAVLASGLGLAAGSALIGIGLGRWRRPRPSRSDGSPEV
jgi:hypothetical protein